MITPSEM